MGKIDSRLRKTTPGSAVSQRRKWLEYLTQHNMPFNRPNWPRYEDGLDRLVADGVARPSRGKTPGTSELRITAKGLAEVARYEAKKTRREMQNKIDPDEDFSIF